MMWIKIATGLALLAGSWTVLYALKMNSWTFVAVYLLNALAQTFLLLNIAHDSNHNAVSSGRATNKLLNYAFDLCGINSYMWRILHHRGHHSCINLHGEDDALTGRGIFRFTPHEPRMRWQRFQHIYGLFVYALFSLDYVFVRDFECFFFPTHDYLKRTKHPLREYAILFAGKAVYVTYMLILPVVILGKSPLLVGGGLPAGPPDHRVDRCAGVPNHAYRGHHILPFQSQRVRQRRVSYFRDNGGLCDGEPGGGVARRRAQSPYSPSSLPFCVPHTLCFADADCEANGRGIWCALPATSDDDAGDPASFDAFEAVGERRLVFAHVTFKLCLWLLRPRAHRNTYPAMARYVSLRKRRRLGT